MSNMFKDINVGERFVWNGLYFVKFFNDCAVRLQDGAVKEFSPDTPCTFVSSFLVVKRK
jgi:hypothetical protein